MNQPLPADVYVTLTGPIESPVTERTFAFLSDLVNGGAKRVHLLINSTGGIVGDGVAIYNFIRNLPAEVITYNGGFIASAAVYVFLGGKKRIASKTASFMIHRTTTGAGFASANQLGIAKKAIEIDDGKLRIIHKDNLELPPDIEGMLDKGNVDITPSEALTYRLIHEISDFSPPVGTKLFYINKFIS